MSEYLPRWAGPSGSKRVKACSWGHSTWRKPVWEAWGRVNKCSWEARSQGIHNHATSPTPVSRRKDGLAGVAEGCWRSGKRGENAWDIHSGRFQQTWQGWLPESQQEMDKNTKSTPPLAHTAWTFSSLGSPSLQNWNSCHVLLPRGDNLIKNMCQNLPQSIQTITRPAGYYISRSKA